MLLVEPVARRLVEQILRELANRLQHPDARLAVGIVAPAEKALLHERGDRLEDVARLVVTRVENGRRGVRPAAVHEHGEAGERALLVCRQKVVAPRDRRPQGLVSLVGIPCTARQEAERAVEPRADRVRREDAHARRCQLDRERQSLESRADRGHRAGVVVGEDEVGLHGSCALDEEHDRVVLERSRGVHRCRLTWCGQRHHLVRPLVRDVEGLAARGDDRHARGSREEGGDVRCRADDLLQIVEDEQDLATHEIGAQRRVDRLAGLLPQAERLRDRRQHELGIANGREEHGEGTVVEPLDELRGCLHRETRLSGPAGARQRQEACLPLAEPARDLRELALTADQPMRRHRKVGRAVAERFQRRKPGVQAIDHEVVETLRLAQVFQSMLAEVAQRHGTRKVVADEVGRRLRHEHLSSVAGAHHARGAVYVEAHVVVTGEKRLSRVETHSHAQHSSFRPAMGGMPALDLRRRGHAIARLAKRAQERVPVRADLDPAMIVERRADEAAVHLQSVRVGVRSELLEQPRRAFDVREQHRDHSARQPRHHREATELAGVDRNERVLGVAR